MLPSASPASAGYPEQNPAVYVCGSEGMGNPAWLHQPALASSSIRNLRICGARRLAVVL